MIVVVVFVAGVVFGALCVGLLMLGGDRRRQKARAARVDANRRRDWDFPDPPPALIFDDPDHRHGFLQ